MQALCSKVHTWTTWMAKTGAGLQRKATAREPSATLCEVVSLGAHRGPPWGAVSGAQSDKELR